MTRRSGAIASAAAAVVVVVGVVVAVLISRGEPRDSAVSSGTPSATSTAAATGAATGSSVTTPTSPSTASAATRVFRSVVGRWSASLPVNWSAVESSDGWGTIRSYDPNQAAFERAPGVAESGPNVPTTEVRIDVQLVFSRAGTGKEAADEYLNNPGPTTQDFRLVSRRDDLVIAGQPASLLLLEAKNPPPAQVRRVYLLVAPGRERVVLIRAWPDNTTRSAELDGFVRTFQLN